MKSIDILSTVYQTTFPIVTFSCRLLSMSELIKSSDGFLKIKNVAVLWTECATANRSIEMPIRLNHYRCVTLDSMLVSLFWIA